MISTLQEWIDYGKRQALEEAAKELEKVTFDMGGDVAAKIVRDLIEKYKEKS